VLSAPPHFWQFNGKKEPKLAYECRAANRDLPFGRRTNRCIDLPPSGIPFEVPRGSLRESRWSKAGREPSRLGKVLGPIPPVNVGVVVGHGPEPSGEVLPLVSI